MKGWRKFGLSLSLVALATTLLCYGKVSEDAWLWVTIGVGNGYLLTNLGGKFARK